MTEKQPKDLTVTVKVSEVERELFAFMAQHAGLALSTYVRSAALQWSKARLEQAAAQTDGVEGIEWYGELAGTP